MPITSQQRKHFKAIAHHLKPVVTVATNGITEGVVNELDRALSDHELIKIKIAAGERADRTELLSEITRLTSSDLVHSIGKTAVLLRHNPKPNPKLSNLIRAQAGH
jgi:RNA-binding protein